MRIQIWGPFLQADALLHQVQHLVLGKPLIQNYQNPPRVRVNGTDRRRGENLAWRVDAKQNTFIGTGDKPRISQRFHQGRAP